MGTLQVIVVALTVGLNALDGFDVLSISFAAPGIVTEWGTTRAALGFVLSAELFGMAIGSIVLGRVADMIGRRPLMLGCLVVMATGMFLATLAYGIYDLMIYRVYTGLGIGGMLASINAVAAEFSNGRRRHMSVSIMAIGYPIGAAVGGTFANLMGFSEDNWRIVFYLGAGVSAAFIPLVYFMIPESVHWLTRKQPAGALERVNAALGRMGHPPVAALPDVSGEEEKPRAKAEKPLARLVERIVLTVGPIFSKALLPTTIIVACAYFFHITTFYYLIKWIPELVSGMGFTGAAPGWVLVSANVGGAAGGAVFAFATLRYGIKALTITVLLLSTVGVTIFGHVPEDFFWLCAISAGANFCLNSAIVGLYAIMAHAYPTHARAQGTGFAIGVGRGGSVLAPIIAGFLFTAEMTLASVSMIMGAGSLIAAVVLMFIKLKPADPEAAEGETAEAPADGAVPAGPAPATASS